VTDRESAALKPAREPDVFIHIGQNLHASHLKVWVTVAVLAAVAVAIVLVVAYSGGGGGGGGGGGY
jgi:hypothetical protein